MHPIFIKFQGKLYVKADAEERVATRAEWITRRPGDNKEMRGPRAPHKVKVDPKLRDERIQGELAPFYTNLSGLKRDIAKLKADYATEFKHYNDIFDEREATLKSAPSPARDQFIRELTQELAEIDGKLDRFEKAVERHEKSIKALEYMIEQKKQPLAQAGESLAVDPKASMLEPDTMKIRKHKELEAAIQRAMEHKQALEQAKERFQTELATEQNAENKYGVEKKLEVVTKDLLATAADIEEKQHRLSKM